MFTEKFNRYACEGDTITAEVDGFTIKATIRADDCSDAPDERQDGFWPSLDPKDAGYIGAKSPRTLARHMAKAQAVMDAWKRDQWFYCGVSLSVKRSGITIDAHAASLWGIDCNYPGSDNSYLAEVANELLPEALEAGRAALRTLCDCAAA